MSKKNGVNRACKLLQLALLWARKGGAIKKRFAMELSVVPKYLKGLTHSAPRKNQIRWGEHELSFDKTPIFHVKIHRPTSIRFLIPCISAEEVDFDHDFGNESDEANYYGYDREEGGEEEEKSAYECCKEKDHVEEQEIDSKAEEFIAKFYEHLKLQRQISDIQLTEMLNRGTN